MNVALCSVPHDPYAICAYARACASSLFLQQGLMAIALGRWCLFSLHLHEPSASWTQRSGAGVKSAHPRCITMTYDINDRLPGIETGLRKKGVLKPGQKIPTGGCQAIYKYCLFRAHKSCSMFVLTEYLVMHVCVSCDLFACMCIMPFSAV